jgi:beta-galactosidase beta subunit
MDLWSDSILVNFAERNLNSTSKTPTASSYLEHPKLRERVGFVQQRVINVYQDTDHESIRWNAGDLVVHFPNCVYSPCFR